MMFLFLIAVFLYVPCSVQGHCNDPNNCNIPIQHYRELGCVPVYTKKNSSCPAFFNCPNLGNRCPNKCYYRGKVYNMDEPVDEANNYGNCVAGCHCATDEPASIICAVYDCARPPFEDYPDCYLAADHTTCCQSRFICPPFENVVKCTVNGTTYYEGQRFPSPTKQKLNCICKPGFNGKYVEPFCLPVNCGIEMYNAESVRKLCAPVFTEDNVCPINWQCAQSSDSIESSKKENIINMKCSYGKKKLNIGDKITIKSSEVYYSDIKCECLIPPLLTCFQTYIGS